MSFLEKLPFSRLVLYLLILGLVPIVVALFAVQGILHTDEVVLNEIDTLKARVLFLEKREASNRQALQHYRDVNPLYIDNQIETLSLLTEEKEKIKQALDHADFMVDDQLKRRLQFLCSGQNKLVLNEGIVQNYGLFQEVIETTASPVEVDRTDIKKILQAIEVGPQTAQNKAPQLIVLDFRLERKLLWEDYEVFSLSMKLLKRDYNTPTP